MRRLMIIGVIALGASLFALPATAHNAGHIHLPNGTCVDVGSGNPGPVPQVDKYKEAPDLFPESDQYGARFAADQGSTPIWPRHCDEPGAHNHP